MIQGGKTTIAIPEGKPAPFSSFKVVATELLWTWWRSGDEDGLHGGNTPATYQLEKNGTGVKSPYKEGVAERPDSATESSANLAAPGIPGSAPPNENATKVPPAVTCTLGSLIDEVDGCEAAFATNSQTADRIEAKEGSIAARWWRAQANVSRFQPNSARMPGIDRIVLLCDELEGEVGISPAKLRRLRAKVCRIKNIPLPKASDLSLDEVASILESGEKPGPDNAVQHGYFELPREADARNRARRCDRCAARDVRVRLAKATRRTMGKRENALSHRGPSNLCWGRRSWTTA